MAVDQDVDVFDVSGEGFEAHIVGDIDCTEGWCDGSSGYGRSGYPKPCPCGGLIHADYGDENWDGDYWLYTKCDQCGEKEGESTA